MQIKSLPGLLHALVLSIGSIHPIFVPHPAACVGEESGAELPLGRPFFEDPGADADGLFQGLVALEFEPLGPLRFHLPRQSFAIHGVQGVAFQ